MNNLVLNNLSVLLELNHYTNKNGCLVTDYKNIRWLKLLASSTNGTSGIAVYMNRKVFFWRNDTTGKFIVEPTT